MAVIAAAAIGAAASIYSAEAGKGGGKGGAPAPTYAYQNLTPTARKAADKMLESTPSFNFQYGPKGAPGSMPFSTPSRRMGNFMGQMFSPGPNMPQYDPPNQVSPLTGALQGMSPYMGQIMSALKPSPVTYNPSAFGNATSGANMGGWGIQG